MAARTGNSTQVRRPPEPTALKLLKGVKPSRINLDEPKVAEGLPPMPDDMLDGADAVWDHVMATIGPSGAITLADGEAVRHYCEATVTYRNLIRTFKKTGANEMIRGNGGMIVANPIMREIALARTHAQVAAREIGASPSSRSTIRVKKAPETDLFEKFLTTPRKVAGGR